MAAIAFLPPVKFWKGHLPEPKKVIGSADVSKIGKVYIGIHSVHALSVGACIAFLTAARLKYGLRGQQMPQTLGKAIPNILCNAALKPSHVVAHGMTHARTHVGDVLRIETRIFLVPCVEEDVAAYIATLIGCMA